MNKLDKLIRSVIKESLGKKTEELEGMVQDEDWNPNGPVNISAQPTDMSEEDEFEMEDDYVMDKIKRECEDDPESESCRKHKEYAGITDDGELEETLHGGQKKLDKNKNGRLDKEDFKLLRGSKKKKEVGEMDLSKLRQGGKYEYESPSFKDELEYTGKKEFPFGKPMHSFKGKNAGGHLMGDEDVESYVSDFNEKKGGMYNMDDEFKDVEPEDAPFNKRRGKDDEYIDFEEMRPTEKKSFFSRMKSKLGLDETDEMEEGNAFTGALAKARKEGDDEFEVDGKKYETHEATAGFGDDGWASDDDVARGYMNYNPRKLDKDERKKEVEPYPYDSTAGFGDDGWASDEDVARGYMNYNPKKIKESIELTESEMIDLIEQIVLEQKSDKSFGGKKPKGMAETEKAQKGSKKENDDYIKSVTKKLKDYLKDGSKGGYETSPKHFPKGNGELAKMDKKTYQADDNTQEYINNFTAAGLENLVYDEIHPNDEWVNSNIEGSSKTGNNPEWANSVDTGVNKKRNQIRKDNLLGAVKDLAYNKAPQPAEIVDARSQKFKKNYGKDAAKKATKILNQLESTESKDEKLLEEEFDRIKNIMGYNKNTQ